MVPVLYRRSQILRVKNSSCAKIIFNFYGWSQPRKLNMDPSLYATLFTNAMGRTTMDTQSRTLKKTRQVYLTRNSPTKPLSESGLECQLNIR